MPPTSPPVVPLRTIAGRWLWIGLTGFGGPPAHITLLRQLCVDRRRWINAEEFEDGIAACNLLPGPASTQLAIYSAWRLRGPAGAIVGGLGFILPGLVAILALSALLLEGEPNRWILAAAAGAGAAVAAVAIRAAADLIPPSWQRATTDAAAGGEARPERGASASEPRSPGHHATRSRLRWLVYAVAGVVAAAVVGAWVVVVLLLAGLAEAIARRAPGPSRTLALALPVGLTGGLAWTAFKVGALSYGGGFVIIPLMQADAVDRYGWMTSSQFLYAVALGQITPGPVVHTVAVVGYAAAGLAGAFLAAVVAFGPSFVFILAGARHFDRLRANTTVAAFLTGAGPAAIGAIGGSAVVLALALSHLWQVGVLALAMVWLVALRRGVVTTLLGAALLGVAAAALGWPVS